MKKLTLMVGVKNEAIYLPEWIEFHLLQGVDGFVIYDNGSTDNLAEALEPYTANGLATIIQVPVGLRNNGAGIWMCHHAIENTQTEWLLISGVDEYLHCPNGDNLVAFLSEFSHQAGVAVSWKMFNSSGHNSKISGLVIERFTDTYREGTPHIKTIIRPDRIEAIHNPHYFKPKAPWQIVNENHETVTSAHPPYVSFNRIRINHYWTMSRVEFETKMRKGRSDVPGQDGVRRSGADDLWNHAHHPNEQTGSDTSLLKYVDAVKEALEKRKAK